MVETMSRRRRRPHEQYGNGAPHGPGRRYETGKRYGTAQPVVRSAAALAAVCAAALLAGGCGGSGAAAERSGGSGGDGADTKAPAAAPASVTGAADALIRAGSSWVATALRTPSGGTWLTITGTGTFDYAHARGDLVLTLPADPAGEVHHKPITELFVPGALYMKDRGAGVPDGKWVRVDTTRLADGDLATGGATEPLAAAELLRGAQQVAYVGAETFQGAAVRHYRGTADIAVAAKDADPASRGALSAAAKGLAETRVAFDAWLDGKGRLRQLSERFTFPGGSGSGGAGTRGAGSRKLVVVSTTRFSGFGSPAAVALPRGADIWTGKIVSAP